MANPSPGGELDPEIAGLVANPIGTDDWGSATLTQVPAMRAARVAAIPWLEARGVIGSLEESDHWIPENESHPQLLVRMIRPHGTTELLPCLYWVHGGGYLFGSAREIDVRLERWAERLGIAIAAIEYRLAPEDPYPTPLEDCYSGLSWVVANAQELGIDPNRIGIGGASAGGGLAAGLGLLTRDRGEITFGFQFLMYPMLDDRNETPSAFFDVPIWPRAANILGWAGYLSGAQPNEEISPYAAPARASDLAHLPPTFIGVGSLDLFLDEDIAYAQALMRAGVLTDLRCYAGAPHGFDRFAPDAAISRWCFRDAETFLSKAFRCSEGA